MMAVTEVPIVLVCSGWFVGLSRSFDFTPSVSPELFRPTCTRTLRCLGTGWSWPILCTGLRQGFWRCKTFRFVAGV